VRTDRSGTSHAITAAFSGCQPFGRGAPPAAGWIFERVKNALSRVCTRTSFIKSSNGAVSKIVALLLHLDAEQHDYFNRVMRGCRRLSNAGFEADGLHDLLGDAGQALFDLASGREQRRDKQGYVAPAQARACQGRAFTRDEASRAAAATCTLGAEHSPHAEQDVVGAFEIGWRILHQDICIATANRLLGVLRGLRVVDRDIQSGIDALRFNLARCTRDGEPWRAGDALDVIMMLDMPAWATLLGLIAECPVIHRGHAHMRLTKGRRIGLRGHFGPCAARIGSRVSGRASSNRSSLTGNLQRGRPRPEKKMRQDI
jgi:hypothetical protein